MWTVLKRGYNNISWTNIETIVVGIVVVPLVAIASSIAIIYFTDWFLDFSVAKKAFELFSPIFKNQEISIVILIILVTAPFIAFIGAIIMMVTCVITLIAIIFGVIALIISSFGFLAIDSIEFSFQRPLIMIGWGIGALIINMFGLNLIRAAGKFE